MKTLFRSLLVAAALGAAACFGGIATAGDYCPAAVKVQAVTVATPVVVQQVVAQPVFVVPSAPTVAIQQVFAAPVVAAFTVPTVVQPVVIQHAVRPVVVQQHAPAVRSLTIQRVRVGR